MARTKSIDNKSAREILKTAQELFLHKGFEGTSINDIASKANLNKSLIYHHFGSKENLWKAVKQDILTKYTAENSQESNFHDLNLKEFLTKFISFRFNFYAKNPNIARLTLWQRLEDNANLRGLPGSHLNLLLPQIINLQERGEIRKDLDPEMVSYFISSTASNGFIDQEPFLKKQSSASRYLEMIIDLLSKALKV